MRCPDFSVIQINGKSYCTSSPPCSQNIRQQLSCAKTGTSLADKDLISFRFMCPIGVGLYCELAKSWIKGTILCQNVLFLIQIVLFLIGKALFIFFSEKIKIGSNPNSAFYFPETIISGKTICVFSNSPLVRKKVLFQTQIVK